MRGRTPWLVHGGFHFDEKTAEGIQARAEPGDVGGDVVGVSGAGGLGRGEGRAPYGEFFLHELFVDGGVDGGGIGERLQEGRDFAPALLVVVGDILPKRPRVAGRIVGIPPTLENRRVQLVAGRRHELKTVGLELAGVKLAGATGEVGEERGEIAELANLALGQGPAEFFDEHGRPLHPEGMFVDGRGGCGRGGDGRGFLRGEQGTGIGGGRPGIRLGEPGETGGVDVAAVVALVAGAFCRPLAPREKERERKFFLFVGDDRLDVVIGVGDDFLDLAGGRERFAELAGAGFKRVEPRAQRGECVRSLDAADDGRTGFGAHSEEGRGRW